MKRQILFAVGLAFALNTILSGCQLIDGLRAILGIGPEGFIVGPGSTEASE